MLEDALRKEQEALAEEIAELLPSIQEFKRLGSRLQHVNALLGVEESEGMSGVPGSTSVNWARLCRENGVEVHGDSGHRALKRLKPEIHAAVPHECLL